MDVVALQRTATKTACANRCRPHGLFPPDDPLLLTLAGVAGSRPFEKHMAGAHGPHQLLPAGGWTTGDFAAQAGFDLRMFWVVSLRHAAACSCDTLACYLPHHARFEAS